MQILNGLDPLFYQDIDELVRIFLFEKYIQNSNSIIHN